MPFPRLLFPAALVPAGGRKHPSEAALPRVNIFDEDDAGLMGELCAKVTRESKAAYLESLHAAVCLNQPR